MPAQGGEAWAAVLLLPGRLRQNRAGGAGEARGEVIALSGMHRQRIHLGLFLDYLQFLCIKTWCVFLFNKH